MVVGEEDQASRVLLITGQAIAHCEPLEVDGMLPLALDDPLHQGWDVHASIAFPRHEELSRDVFRKLLVEVQKGMVVPERGLVVTGGARPVCVGKADAGWRLQENNVAELRPSILVLIEHGLAIIPHLDVDGAQLRQKSVQGGAAWTPVEPD